MLHDINVDEVIGAVVRTLALKHGCKQSDVVEEGRLKKSPLTRLLYETAKRRVYHLLLPGVVEPLDVFTPEESVVDGETAQAIIITLAMLYGQRTGTDMEHLPVEDMRVFRDEVMRLVLEVFHTNLVGDKSVRLITMDVDPFLEVGMLGDDAPFVEKEKRQLQEAANG